jgi:hypothetical protein
LKFTIRDLLLVTVIVALAVGWWADRSRLAEEVNRLKPAELHLSPDGTITPSSGFPAMGLKGRPKNSN